jgi:hypothetical protein
LSGGITGRRKGKKKEKNEGKGGKKKRRGEKKGEKKKKRPHPPKKKKKEKERPLTSFHPGGNPGKRREKNGPLTSFIQENRQNAFFPKERCFKRYCGGLIATDVDMNLLVLDNLLTSSNHHTHSPAVLCVVLCDAKPTVPEDTSLLVLLEIVGNKEKQKSSDIEKARSIDRSKKQRFFLKGVGSVISVF